MFLNGHHCRSGAHCIPCRTSESFRQKLLDKAEVEERDFACEWGADPPKISDGPGTRLARILKRLGITHQSGCACHDNVIRMNMSGKRWVRENTDEVVRWMHEEAANRGLPFSAFLAKRLVLHCAR